MYHFNPQGTEYEKNMLAFADTQPITFAGKQQIKLAIARAFKNWKNTPQLLQAKEDRKYLLANDMCTLAVDKQIEKLSTPLNLDKAVDYIKLKWYNDNKHHLSMYIHEAGHPTEAQAQLMSMQMVNDYGFTNIPVELDASNSQLQVIAAITGDLTTAHTCNIVTDNKVIADAYKILANYMQETTGLKFHREEIKKSQMIDGYGAGEKLVTKQLQDDLGSKFTDSCVEAFYAAQTKMSPVVHQLKEYFQGIWNSNQTRYQWPYPNGFVTDYRPVDTHTIKVNPFGLGEIDLLAKINKSTKRSTGLGVNVIHGFDGYIASEMVVRHPNNQIWSIHDGFKVHPNDAKTALTNYNTIVGELVDGNWLEVVTQQLTGTPLTINKQFTSADSKTSAYSIS